MELISCIRNPFNSTAIYDGIKNAAVCTKNTATKIFKSTISTLNQATCSVDARSYSHLFTDGLIGFVSVIRHGELPESLGILKATIDTVEGIFSTFDIFDVTKYFGFKNQQGNQLPRIVRQEGVLKVKNKNYETTKARFHVKEHKYQKVAAQVGFFIKATGAIVSFFDKYQITNLTAWGQELSKIPGIGGTLAKIVTPVFFTTMVSVGGVIAFGALTIDSIIYLAKAVKDPEKDVVKGLIDLASRVSLLALYSVSLAGLGNPVILATVSVVGGLFGIAGMIHSSRRENRKEAVEAQNYQEMMQPEEV